MSSPLPEDVHRFIMQCIDSVEQLEVLLLLQGSPAVEWTPDQVARSLYSNPDSIARRLGGLHEKELLTTNGSRSWYRYQPGTPELAATVKRLAETYRERRVAVITLIASKPMDKVRAFSEAFRLRRKDKE